MKHPGLAVEVIVVNDGDCPLDGQRLSAMLPGLVIIAQDKRGPSGARAQPGNGGGCSPSAADTGMAQFAAQPPSG